MRSRILALPLCLAMCLGLLAGCGSSSTSTTESDEQETTVAEAAEETEAESEATAETEPASEAEPAAEAAASADEATAESTDGNEFTLNLPGADTAELSFSNVYSLPLSDSNETITIMRTALNLMGDLANLGIETFQEMEYIQYIQELTGVTMEITELPYETASQQMSLVIASGDMPDVFCNLTYSTGDEGALEDGVIVDLTEYAEYAPNYFYMIESNEDQANAFLSDGKVLKFMSPYDQYRANQGMVIRSDWLEELGLEVPETYDEMTAVLEAFQDAYGCESTIYMNEQCYITGLSDGYDVEAFAADGSTDTTMPYYVEDGTVYCSLNSEGYRDYLAMLNEWYESGLISSDFYSVEYDPFSDYLSNQINDGEMGVWVTSGEGIDNYSVPITCVPMLVQEEGDMDHIFTTSLTADSQNDCYVTTSCEDLELCISFLDYWYSLDGIVFSNYDIEGVSYEVNEDNEPEFTEAVVNNEYGLSVSNMMCLYCGYGVWSSPLLRMRTAEYNSDLANEAWEVWSSNLDGSMDMPDYTSLNTEQSETEGYYSSDILTYALQTVPQFIMGELNLEDDRDRYCARLEEMGINECIAAWQKAYDNVMS